MTENMKQQQRERGQGWAITSAQAIKLTSLLLLLRITSAGKHKRLESNNPRVDVHISKEGGQRPCME